MVAEGQYLERAVIIPAGAHALEGLFHRGTKKTGVLICPPGPVTGGSMESAVVAELAWAVTRAGHPTLRFNYAGVGASPGTFSVPGARSDASSALAHLKACLSEDADVALIGVGLGAEVGAELAVDVPFDAAFLVLPRASCLPERLAATRHVVVAVPELGDATEAEALSEWGETAVRDFRLVRLARADPSFRRGLVELGRAAAETISPPGMVEL
ncbi:MAG: hypothetical protein ACFB9M_06785 [Myxococcota bacterium]